MHAPGNTFEDYVVWKLNLVVDHHGQDLWYLGIAQEPATQQPRKRISWCAFQNLMFVLAEARLFFDREITSFDPSRESWKDFDRDVLSQFFDEDIVDGCNLELHLRLRH